MNLLVVATFVALVEEGSYALAAMRLHCSQSTISYQLNALERDLGVRLIERGPGRQLVVTKAGCRFHGHAQAIIAAVDAARSAVEGTRRVRS